MKKKLDRRRVLEAALAIIDADGLGGLSMRKVGAALGVEAMSLYNHVPSKAALLDGVHEMLLLSLEEPPKTRSWQAYARHQAHALYDVLLAHPNTIPLFATRPAATTSSIERLDRYLSVLTDAGFGIADAIMLVQLLAQLVVGHAIWTLGPEGSEIDYTSAPKNVRRALDAIERARRSEGDRELTRGIEALIRGFDH